MFKKTIENIFSLSRNIIEEYKKNGKVKDSNIEEFKKHLFETSELFYKDNMNFLSSSKEIIKKMFLNYTFLLSSSNSIVSLTYKMKSKDYMILLDLYRNLIVSLDGMSSTYWRILLEGTLLSGSDRKWTNLLNNKINYSFFGGTSVTNEDEFNKAFKEDLYFKDFMSEDLWMDIKSIDNDIYLIYEQEEGAISNEDIDEKLINNVTKNLWFLLAINFDYLMYLDKLLV